MRRRIVQIVAMLGLFALGSVDAIAGGGVVVTIIDGRKAKADITLPNPSGGNYTAEFEIEFETQGLQNLTVECIGISADVLDAGEIAAIRQNLPHPTTQIIDPAFPVRVTVEPPAACGLAFEDQYEVSLETSDLVYAPFSPYRLVKAPIGGFFKYVTESVTSGSVRVRGGGGGFSEFVMISDTSPDYPSDCRDQYDALEALLRNNAISPTARRSLMTDLEVSRAAYEAGDFAAAIAHLAAFYAHCAEFGGAALPNRWRSSRDLDNIEGELVSGADSLKFMMGRLNGSP